MTWGGGGGGCQDVKINVMEHFQRGMRRGWWWCTGDLGGVLRELRGQVME